MNEIDNVHLVFLMATPAFIGFWLGAWMGKDEPNPISAIWAIFSAIGFVLSLGMIIVESFL